MSYPNEDEMYPDVCQWLESFLSQRLRGSQVGVHDTHRIPLNSYVQRFGLQDYFENDIWQTYDIRVDITAFIRHRRRPHLVFVECKTIPISLMHVSQLLGYSRVANPLYSYLLSTRGVGSSVKTLITTYDRTDILEYHWAKGDQPRSIILATWNRQHQQIDLASVLPPGAVGAV